MDALRSAPGVHVRSERAADGFSPEAPQPPADPAETAGMQTDPLLTVLWLLALGGQPPSLDSWPASYKAPAKA